MSVAKERPLLDGEERIFEGRPDWRAWAGLTILGAVVTGDDGAATVFGGFVTAVFPLNVLITLNILDFRVILSLFSSKIFKK